VLTFLVNAENKNYIKCNSYNLSYIDIFITRQHSMHAERDIALPILSICPVLVLCLNKWTNRHTFLTVW